MAFCAHPVLGDRTEKPGWTSQLEASNMDNISQQPTRRRLPNPKWLPIVALLLAIWAMALGVWWSRPQLTPAAAQPRPTARPSVVARATPQASETVQPTTEGTPDVLPVVRDAGQIVQQEEWLTLAQAFDVNRALADIAELTKAKYAGRAVGSPGGRLAGDWIAERFAEYGLQPAGDSSTFFQEFPVPYAELAAMPSFELLDDDGQTLKEYHFRYDYTIWLGGYADGGQAEGPVVWVSDGNHDDYDGLNVEGAIVLCRYQYPPDPILRQALEHGAKAVLLMREGGIYFRMRRTARSNALLPQGIPAFLVDPEVASDLLAGSGLTLDDLSIEYQARPLATRVRVDLPMLYRTDATGRNVLGVLPGSDPDGVQQIVIIGGHYDHIGADPDGTAWVGANDNASGIAVLLEIAQQWQEQGYVPRRTVLFAAWDGEEIGLNGSTYYVEHPRYPLSDTVSMLQLDMVGAGTPNLGIDAGGLIADQSIVSAAQLGIAVAPQSLGRSDHAPFVGAGVPATLYIWWDGDAPGLVYHVPEDDLDNIEPHKLKAAGELADLVLLNLSWEDEELEDLKAQYEQAIATHDLDAFLPLIDPHDRGLLRQQEEWLSSLMLHPTAEFTATVGQPLVAGHVATSTITLRYRWQTDDRDVAASFPARWVRRGLDWHYGGPAWDELQSEHALVEHLQQPDLAERLAQETDTLYGFLTEDVGLDLPETLHVAFYGSANLLNALHRTPQGYEQASGWAVEDGVVLSQQNGLNAALAEFALQRTGWPTQTVHWLAQGLLDERRATDADEADQLESQHMPVLLQAYQDGTLWALEDMPSRHEVESKERTLWNAQAWAMTNHVLQADGWSVLQTPAAVVSEEWPSTLLEPWHLAAQGIEDTLEQRARAVLARDQEAFLATVDPENRVLYWEETHWFEDLEEYPADEFAYESQLISLDGDQATVELTVRYNVPNLEGRRVPLTYRARFVRAGEHWLCSDVDFLEQHSEHFVLKYENPQYALYADRMLADAERAYDQVTTDLEADPQTPIEIKLYHQSDLSRFSIYMSMFRITGWNEPGESIKLNISGREQLLSGGAARVIAHELTHAALFAKGVQHGALHEGTAEYEAIRFDPQRGNVKVRKYRQEVYDLVRSKRPLTVEDLDDWRAVDPEDLSLFYSVGWDAVTYFRQRFGRETFLEWLRLLATDTSFQEAFGQATRMAFTDFDAEWRKSVLRGHIAPDDIQTALGFDGERALQHVETLAQPAWTGREAGTPGNEAAAQYIADQFASYGLQPAGDNGTYMQSLNTSRTALTAMPVLALLDEEGQTHSLQYRVDFHQLLGGHAGSGQVEKTIVYVRDVRNEDLHLGGRVLLTRASADRWQDAREATARGAGGLLLITDKWEKHVAVKTSDVRPLREKTIPVYELTEQAAESLFRLAGYAPRQLDELPPVLPLPLSAHMDVQLAVTSDVSVANVLAVLPGSDPQVSDQVLILGAHLDHVGSLPDGTVFPGANNDASGVAVLLEIARLWRDTGYRPRRTVLFAAWNATEMGLLGSRYYVTHPAYALQKTLAVIQLDRVGQGAGYYIIVSGDETQEALILAHLENDARQVKGRLTFEKYQAGSDHEPFHQRGIPAVMLSWERPQYTNVPEDTPETIDAQKLRATGRVSALTLMTLADE